MDRHFILPVSVALAVHAGLAFGFRSARTVQAVATRAVEKEYFQIEVMPPLPDETVPTDARRGSPDAAPMSPEPPVLVSECPFNIQTPPIERVTVEPTNRIPSMPPGVLDGIETGTRITAVFTELDLDSPPRARLQPQPQYPNDARRSELAGEVYIEFMVSEAGTVGNIRVIRASAMVFVEPTLRAVERWRFAPGKRNGVAVSFRMAVPVIFKLGD